MDTAAQGLCPTKFTRHNICDQQSGSVVLAGISVGGMGDLGGGKLCAVAYLHKDDRSCESKGAQGVAIVCER